ncbi:hypothetical protein VI34_03115 [Methylophilales bacterium MBRSG12]|uniref:PLD phosphodiesterase domain-containing protein n=1 Tax=Methylophilales bacterium MBRS-H7 TaxID=1623450 RepID=A0A0H4IXM7_9PROT|nr:hypothetical protein VI33_03115 [Methylophilales bacterium MBRS-H7]AKO67057.1 hypothetical protein VI34_03115 [Methylophilales bacterium MBRSG12]
MKRNHFRKSIVEIEELVRSNPDEQTTQEIIHELGFRKTGRAKKLLTKLTKKDNAPSNDTIISDKPIQQKKTTQPKKIIRESKEAIVYEIDLDDSKYDGNDNEADEQEFEVAEPIFKNKKNQKFEDASEVIISSANDNFVDPSNSSLIETENLFENFCNAIDIEVEAIKKQSQEQVIEITNGVLIESTEDFHIYQFPYKEAFHIREDIPVIITIGGVDSSGTIVSFKEKKLQISIPDNYGKLIGLAQIKIDNSFLYVKLKERIEAVTSSESTAKFNSSMAKKVIGEEDSTVEIDEMVVNDSQLNDAQYQSLKVASASEVLYLWGPPGTGKTFTLAKVIDMFYQQEKRVLLVSNTNLAVDLLLKSLCKHLKNKKDEEFFNSSVIRFGSIHDPELEKKYGEYINIEKAIEKKTAELINEREELRNKILKIQKKEKKWLDIERAFSDYESALAKYTKSENSLIKITSDLDELNSEIEYIKESLLNLDKEKKESEQTGTLKRFFTNKRKIQDIEIDIENNINRQEEIAEEPKQLEIQIKELSKKNKSEKSAVDDLHKLIENEDLNEIKNHLKASKDEIAGYESRINDIAKEVDLIKIQIMHHCKILAATATQVFLKPDSFNMFDVVIIDESSMLPLPLVAYVSGLSKEKVTVTGDFRQLPPIVTANKDAGVMKWIGTNVFERAGIEAGIEKGKSPDNLVKLTTQYRMREPICKLINERFYDGTLETAKTIETEYTKNKKNVPKFFTNPLMVIDTSKQYPFSNIKPRTYSKYNILHGIVIRNLLYHLQNNGYTDNPHELGVIAPFAAQADLIAKLIDERGVTNVECGTVHRFQGNEKDIIFYDLVESYGNLYTSKNINDAKLINVALSRSKYHLVFIANLDYLNQRLTANSPMRSVISEVIKKGKVIDAKEVINLGPASYDVELEDVKSENIDFDKNGSKFFDQKTFDKAVFEDVRAAKKSVVIFSGFSTPNRIAIWSDLFRQKISEGIKIRCVTRSPRNQGNIDEGLANEAINALTKIGVVVDLRHEIHEKAVFIDENIFWYGSLNPLSHTGKTEESMLRVPSKQLCLLKARYEIYKRGYKNEDSPFSIITEKENPDCPKCKSLITFHHRGKFGPYYHCESCQWKESVDKFNRNNLRSNEIDEISENKPVEKETKCNVCNKPMKLKKGRFGYFYGCTGYPQCKNTEKA